MAKQDEVLGKFLHDPKLLSKYNVDPNDNQNKSFAEKSEHAIVELIKYLVDQHVAQKMPDITLKKNLQNKAHDFAGKK